METTQYEPSIMSANEGTIKRQFSLRQLTFNSAGIILGIAFILSASYGLAEISSLYMLLMTAGWCLVALFGVRLFTRAADIVYLPTHSSVKQVSLYFKGGELENIKKAVEKGDIKSLKELSAERNSGIKMDVMYSRDGKFASVQLFNYVPYNYEVASKVYCIQGEASAQFQSLIRG